jgi:hypothetical protein
MNLPGVSELIISEGNCSREMTDYMNVCEKLWLDIKQEDTYEYNEDVNGLDYEKGQHQNFQTLAQCIDCSEFGRMLYGKTVCIAVESSPTREKSVIKQFY